MGYDITEGGGLNFPVPIHFCTYNSTAQLRCLWCVPVVALPSGFRSG